jgi:ubiquinone/menaquinone biosynthesis C-methylase UbiE
MEAANSPWRRFGQVFDQGAEVYDDVRPGYSPALLDLALERGGLAAGSRVLEVGCGTGKLTELLLERGLRIDAVDPGRNMIAVAQKRLGPAAAVSFHVGAFEEVRLPEGAFAAVFSATAFHWIDPQISWSKAASCLEPGGLLALLTHLTVRDERSGPAQDGFFELLRPYAPEVAEQWNGPPELEVILDGAPERRHNVSEVWDWLMSAGLHRLAVPGAADLFEEVEVAREIRAVEETPDDAIAFLRTTSLYHRIDPTRREAFEEDNRRLIEQLGGRVYSPLRRS